METEIINENGKESPLKQGDAVGSFFASKEGLEAVIVLHLDPKHPKYMKFLGMLESIRMKQKGLIKYTSGL